MKILTIFGGPKMKGKTASALQLFEEKAAAGGNQVERINISEYKICAAAVVLPAWRIRMNQAASRKMTHRQFSKRWLRLTSLFLPRRSIRSFCVRRSSL